MGSPARDELASHWDAAYAEGDEDRSWTQQEPRRSLEAIEAVAPARDAAILDVGGGSSPLAARLVAAGYRDVTVLDLSAAALDLARGRMGTEADRVHWVHADLLRWTPLRRYAVWHDRALLHFLIEDEQRERYVTMMRAALARGGHAIIATFSPDGPAECSGLPVRGSSALDTWKLLGPEFGLVAVRVEQHITPSGAHQSFSWLVARMGA